MAQLTYQQIEDLWTQAGGNPTEAPIAAAVAWAESGGTTDALHTKAPDYSVGLWQINYYGNLLPGRTAQYGSPDALLADPLAQAKAAIAISGNGANWSPWSTFLSGAYLKYLLTPPTAPTGGGSVTGVGAGAGGGPGAAPNPTPASTTCTRPASFTLGLPGQSSNNAGEWLKFAAAVKASMEILESDCLRLVAPQKFARSKMEIVKESRTAEPEVNEED